MLRSVKFLILFFWGFLFLTNAINAQDIEPELPDYLRTTTSTTTTTTTTEVPPETTTEVPPETSTQPSPTLADTTTNLPSTNFIETTTPIPLTTTSTRPTPTIPTWIPPPATSHKPYYPPHWGNRCYYKEQRGMAYLKWFCGNLRWVHSVDCFHCCYYDFSSFAGCSKVSHHYCAHYVD